MEWLARWARDRPDAPFLIREASTVDFATAWGRVASMAGGLQDRYGPGARLGVVMRHHPDSVLAVLAVQTAGMVAVPLPDGVPDVSQLAAIARLEGVVQPEPGRMIAPVEADPVATCVAVFTSGSSGIPRPVGLTWGNIDASAAAVAAHLSHRSDDRWLAVLPLHHVGALSIVWRSAREGSAVVLAGPFDANRTATMLSAGDVTLGSFVGAMLESLAEVGLERAPGFRHGLVGGGPAGERALSVAGMNLLATYGMTETASAVATADPSDPDPARLVPHRGATIAITDGGRITVEGAMVSPADLDGPPRTGSLVTGDIGRLHEGRLEVVGRADDVIVTGGENVMPSVVESAIGRVSGAGTVAVVGLPDSRWGQVVACAYTGTVAAEELASAARAALPSHAVPRRWLRVDTLPLRGIGKVDRAAVLDLFD